MHWLLAIVYGYMAAILVGSSTPFDVRFGCLLYNKVMANPLTTPCLDGAEFRLVAHETKEYRRKNIETQKKELKCPSWQNEMSDFLQNPQHSLLLLVVPHSYCSPTMQRASLTCKDVWSHGDGISKTTSRIMVVAFI
nr:E3 ubiquitin-protein ligase ORTHRUS 2-like [Ipomoea batatas]